MRSFIVFCSIALTACGQVRVHVVNESRFHLKNVSVVARGATTSVGDLAPGAKREVSICPEGESSLSARFTVEGREHTSEADSYVECDSFYHVRLEVHQDLSATAEYVHEEP
jgi:hypothetical protein